MSADIVILNGACLTFDPAHPSADAVAIRGKVIVAVGTSSDMRAMIGPHTRVIDAKGGTVLPGFIDSHVHLFIGSAELDMLDLSGIHGREALQSAVRAYAEGRPDEPLIMGVGVDYDVLGSDRRPTRHDLDRILPDRPLSMMTADHHTVFANTAALDKAGILHDTQSPDGSEIVSAPDGTATGQLNETGAFGPVLRLSALGGRDLVGYVSGKDPEPPATARERAHDKDILLRGLRHCASHGITGLHNMDGNFYQLELLSELEAEGRLPIRVQVPMHLKNTDPLDRLIEAAEMRHRFDTDMVYSGRVKMFMDGVLDTYTAFMLTPYPGRPESCGEAQFEAAHFNEACIRADAMGLQISVHAIGDAAVRRVLDGYEAAQIENGIRDSRHRVEHIEVIDPIDLPRVAKLGAVASVQPMHSPQGGLFPPYPPGDILSAEQITRSFGWKALHESGARLCFSTDWPVVPVDVMPSIAAAVHSHPLPAPWLDNRLPLVASLAAYTRENAWVEFNEHRKGKLKPGYLADIAVQDRNLFECPLEALSQVRTRYTICDGTVTYED